MINKKMFSKKVAVSVGSFLTGASLLMGLAAIPASAQTIGASVGVSASTSVGANISARLGTIITRSNSEISQRITMLNALSARVGEMVNVSATEKTDISNEVNTNVTGLTALQTKIDADTTTTAALSDEKTIFGTFRIYALVIPQGYIEVAANRVGVIDGLMTTVSGELQTRISADQAAGDNVTSLQASLADMNTQITNSGSQAQIAQNGVVSLTPDQGNTTIAASNHAALVSARANIKTATSDLVAARHDASVIYAGLKGFEVTTTASTTVSQ